MTEDIQFFHNPFSRGRIVHWMLEEVGAKYRVNLLEFDKQEQKTENYLRINPMGKVPAIIHRDTVITEAAAICTYLADAFPASELAPIITDAARGTYLRWMFFGAGCVEPALADRMYPRKETPRPGALGYGSYEDTVNTLERALSPGPYILGERFSAADVYVGSQIDWGMMTQSLESRPVFKAYLDRIKQRPAFKRFSSQSEALAARIKAENKSH